ncbi:hypothetical protein K32_04570 [Kaistia sp. 32K]|uniref:DUF2239 family protein n=1 Tax=Kaistia sp. 32K TaxID=2795690 RepID=UPI0019151342|nr:DUF2239 family protein [Kaistia sp. 32K]BCP51840.1 hypothetical protein K32_04570 [Kaistia sp. 32K]
MSVARTIYCTAFQGLTRIASGVLPEVALKSKAAMEQGGEPVLLFDDETSRPIEVDFRGSPEEVLERLNQPPAEPGEAAEAVAPARGPGRPKLGVVAREVTLLPRHWAWLTAQPGGASVTLRRLVDEARRASEGIDRMRQAREATLLFMTAMAGNLPHYEDATRALFAGDRARFGQLIEAWPVDVRDHTEKLAGPAFETA